MGARERCEDGERVVVARPHGPWRRECFPFVELEGHVERLRDALVTHARERLGPPMRDHAVDRERLRDTRHLLDRLSRNQHEPRSEVCEIRRERVDRREKELYPVRYRLRPHGREEIRIDHEERNDVAILHRVDERRVIRNPKVLSSEPDERSHGGAARFRASNVRWLAI